MNLTNVHMHVPHKQYSRLYGIMGSLSTKVASRQVRCACCRVGPIKDSVAMLMFAGPPAREVICVGYSKC